MYISSHLTALCAVTSLLLTAPGVAAKPRHHRKHHSKPACDGGLDYRGSSLRTTTSKRPVATTTSKAPVVSKTRTSAVPPAQATGVTAIPAGATRLDVDFGDYTSGTAKEFLAKYGLLISDYPVASEPIPHTFVAENVAIKDGTLQLLVSAEGAQTDVKSAEVFTEASNLKYLNITTRAKSGKSEGVCSGFFTYLDDTQEADIEILTSYITKGYGNGAVPPGLEFTNQPLNGGGPEKATNAAVAWPFDPSEAFHDYTLEWSADATRFYVDGKMWKELTTNVPTAPSQFIWNSWSSGDPYWSAGPPSQDNILQIESISGWYTTA